MDENDNIEKEITEDNTTDEKEVVEELTDEDEDIKLEDDDIMKDESSEKTGFSLPSSFNGGGNDLKKRLILIMGIILGLFLVIGLFMGIASIFNKPSYTYEDVEDIMKDAAKEYFADHKKSLPKGKQVVAITDSTLIKNEYMDEMSEYLGEDTSCSGRVTVKKVDGKYAYTPYLNCGSEYNSTELHKALKKKIVTSGEGLYSVNNGYIFRGEKVKNYVKMNKKTWRVVKISGNNEVMLVLNSVYENSSVWDDRFNTTEGYNSGINDYKASRIREFLKKTYRDKDKDTKILSTDDKAKMVNFDLCIAKRKVGSTVKDNSIECGEVLSDQKMGLLTVSDYMFASLDPKCTKDNDPSCQNYNYLATDYEWVLVTASKNNDSEIFYISNTGEISTTEAMTYSDIRPVIMLSSDTMVKGGKGTKSKPYIVR